MKKTTKKLPLKLQPVRALTTDLARVRGGAELSKGCAPMYSVQQDECCA